MQSKPCRKCKKIKPLTEYHRHPTAPDGHKYVCKACYSIYEKEYYRTSRKAARKAKTLAKYRLEHNPSDHSTKVSDQARIFAPLPPDSYIRTDLVEIKNHLLSCAGLNPDECNSLEADAVLLAALRTADHAIRTCPEAFKYQRTATPQPLIRKGA